MFNYFEEFYNSDYKEIQPNSDDKVIIFDKNSNLVLNNDSLFFSYGNGEIEKNCTYKFLCNFDNINYFICLTYDYKSENIMSLKESRSLSKKFDRWVIAYGFHIYSWYKKNQFCGLCGKMMEFHDDERSLKCENCNNVVFPKIAPASIVLITRGDELLLAKGHNFGNIYGLVAGFINPGESAEQCVSREILEETGLIVKNIKYRGSQPWPYSSTLMLAFEAEYESGDLKIDYNELADAKWFNKDNLPNIPTKDSIAGQLIRKFYNLD